MGSRTRLQEGNTDVTRQGRKGERSMLTMWQCTLRGIRGRPREGGTGVAGQGREGEHWRCMAS
jgi:hypothetical protein